MFRTNVDHVNSSFTCVHATVKFIVEVKIVSTLNANTEVNVDINSDQETMR